MQESLKTGKVITPTPHTHRAKSEISYDIVFHVHDRCRIDLIHMSATNPIEEILTILPCFLHCGICHLSCNQSYRGNLNNPVVFLDCGICHLSCNQSYRGNLNNPVCHLSCNLAILDGKSQQSCCVPTLWDMPPIL